MDSASSGVGSVSRIALEIEILGKATIPCELVRHLAPITSRSIMTNLPLQGRAHKYGEIFAYFETGLVIGAEKQRKSFKRGELGFLVSNGSICMFLKDASTQPMNPLGRITGGLDSIESLRPGDVVKIKEPTA